MIIEFPFSPKIDQIYTQGNLSWQWNGIQWVDYTPVVDNLNISNALSIGGKITGYNSAKIINGQVLIGNSLSGSFESATLTGGSGIDIANDSGTITITANVAAISGAANSVSNGGGITGYITGGGVLTLGSNGSSANGASTIVTRGADGSFVGNVITAAYGNIWGNAGTGSASFSGGTTLARLSGNTSAYSEPRLEFGERALNATAAIASKNETNGGGSFYILTRNTSSSTSTLTTRMRITDEGNLVVYGNVLSNSANSVADIGNSTNYFGNIYGKAIIASTLNDSIGSVRDLPLNTQTTLYTLATTDNGKLVTSNVNVTVPNSVFSSGQTVSLYNNSAASWTLIQSTNVTMYLAGTASTGNRTLSQRGLATVICVAANTFVVSGAGLS